MPGLMEYLVLSGALFSIGLYGALTKRNIVVVLMCIEIMLNAVNIALVAFNNFTPANPLAGQAFAVFIITVAAVEVAVGLALVIAIYRTRDTVDVTRVDTMRW
jgi:NADH:ubiquinone oxidoreductase subunit K